jgi:uncharacterized membrane protein
MKLFVRMFGTWRTTLYSTKLATEKCLYGLLMQFVEAQIYVKKIRLLLLDDVMLNVVKDVVTGKSFLHLFLCSSLNEHELRQSKLRLLPCREDGYTMVILLPYGSLSGWKRDR